MCTILFEPRHIIKLFSLILQSVIVTNTCPLSIQKSGTVTSLSRSLLVDDIKETTESGSRLLVVKCDQLYKSVSSAVMQ